MITRIAAAFIIAILMTSSLGCAKMGKATGEAVKEIKKMPSDFHDGYKEGRAADSKESE